MTLAVDPKAYYQAATNCFDAASALRDSFLYIFAELSDCGSMAGVDENGQQWAGSYNTSAFEAVGFFQDVHSTLYAYGGALNDIGFTHAQADASMKGAPQPDKPTTPGMPVFGPFSVPASAGGPGQGIVDKGINIASHIGIPIPDGDTGKLAKAADAWDRLGTIYQNTNARDKITISAGLFDTVTADDASYIRDDLKSLANSIDQLLTACKQISQSCIEYRDALNELRAEIKVFLEGLAKDLAIDAAITVGLALISFGAGAVTAAKAVHTLHHWAGKIKDGIIAWRARKALQIAGLKQDAKDAVVKARKVVTDLRDRLRKKVDDSPEPPKKSLRQELDNATVTTDRKIDIAHGPPNGYVVKKDANGNITNYVQYDENGRGIKRVDLTGRPHGTVPTPHVVEIVHDVAPDGTVYVRELTKQVRPATPDEIP
ncbi:polymorphic toxin type 24 domain-containing protein [Nocardia sp. NPDC051787]|uniref:polymorphic toxin type 24 domain-containing protein n=1 Tax=Nocardia sp. NPDC051787 TaxID=3155415 RepID=UPI003418461A